jgi:hypothetical protein
LKLEKKGLTAPFQKVCATKKSKTSAGGKETRRTVENKTSEETGSRVRCGDCNV